MLFPSKHSTVNILENILHGVIATDTRGHIVYWNRASENIFGYLTSEVQNKPVSILFDENSDPSLRELISECLKGKPVIGRWQGLRKNGTLVCLEVRAQRMTDGENNHSGCIITVTDVEHQKETEERLQQNRAIAEAILCASSDAIIRADENGMIQSVNSSACAMFGYSEEEFYGKSLKILMPFPYSIAHDRYMRDYLLTNEKMISGKGRETTGLRKDGTVFPIEYTVSEICNDGKKVYAGIIRDLTARRKLERKLIDISNKERMRIGSDLHDGLGQMLTGIRMLAESLARKLNANALPGAEEVQEIADMIREADEMARTISRDMVQVDLETRGLHVAIDDFCSKISKITGVEYELLTSGAFEIEDHSTALHLYRIVQEAVNNAIKHGKPGKICVRLSQTDHHISVIIDDNGSGFDPKTVTGKGAGLEIMKHRAGIMGGILEFCRSEEGNTRVRCLVPKNLNHFA